MDEQVKVSLKLAKHDPEIIYEDEALLVLNKPPGIHSVRQKDSDQPSVAAWLMQRNPAMAAIGKHGEDGGLIQRLDFETSGIMIAAKKAEIWEKLRRQLLQGQIEKSYYCLVQGKFQKRAVKLDNYIGSRYRRGQKVRVYSKKPGKPHRVLSASSTFELLKYFSKENCSLLKVQAPTARRHQIRAHAAFLEHALLGDSLYGSKRCLPAYHAGFFLQAFYTRFIHPLSGKKMEFEVPCSCLF